MIPTPLCIGFGIAAEIASSEALHAERERIAAMGDAFEATLGQLLLDSVQSTSHHPRECAHA